MKPPIAFALFLAFIPDVYRSYVEGCGGCPSGGGPSKYVDVTCNALSRSLAFTGIHNGNRTERSAIWSEITSMISDQNCHFIKSIFKSHNLITTRFWSVPIFIEPISGCKKEEPETRLHFSLKT